jgi:hypothetical protein
MRLIRLFALMGAVGLLALGQTSEAPHIAVKDIPADPADVSTIDALMKALYAVISGPAGLERNWSRAKNLFIPDIRMIATNPNKAGQPNVRMISFQEYVDRVAIAVEKQGFYESEIKRSVRQFGNVAQVFSSYQIKHELKGEPVVMGINALQLYFDGHRWWIASIVWDTDRPGNQLPKELAPE